MAKINPLTKVLIKIFVRGFYRKHAGALLFFFVSIFSYCFFIQVLNETHLTPADRVLQNLLFVISLLTSPPLLAFVFLIWLGFTIKSWKYVAVELVDPRNQFLFYSCTAARKSDVFKSWFVVQFLISLPLILFGIFSLVVGLIYQHILTPVIILLFILSLDAVFSFLLTKKIFGIDKNERLFAVRLIQPWKKPFFSLFLFKVAVHLPLMFILTKIFSFAVLTAGIYLFPDIADYSFKTGGLMALGIGIAHTLVVFESFRFEQIELTFIRNFPWSTSKLFLNWLFTFLVLILPECVWLLVQFKLLGVGLIIFVLSICLLLRSILYGIGLQMKPFLHYVFYLFIGSFIFILFGLMWLVVLLLLMLAWLIFRQHYYGAPSFAK